MTNKYVIDLESASLKVTMAVNDVVLSQLNDGWPAQVSSLLNPWLRNGANLCTVTMAEPVPTGREKPAELEFIGNTKNRKLKARITRSSGSDTLWQYQFPEDAGGDVELPHSNPLPARQFNVNDDIPRWVWDTGPAVVRVAEVEASLFAAFREIHSAFQSSDVERLMALGVVRNKEMAQATNTNPDDYVQAVRRSWTRTFSTTRPLPLPRLEGPQDLLFEPAWEGHLFKVMTLDGRQPLETERDAQGLVIAYSVYLGREGAVWRWVR